MGTFRIKPTSDKNLNHNASSGSNGYSLISEDVADGDSTYIYQTISSNSSASISSRFNLSGVLPKTNICITSAKLSLTARSDGDVGGQSCVGEVRIGDNLQSFQKTGDWGSYTESSAEMNQTLIDAINNSIKSNKTLPTIELQITTAGALNNWKSDNGTIRLTQTYIEVTYEETESRSGAYIKIAGTYQEAKDVYQKQNGTYIKITDPSTILNTTIRYINGN